jgi:hypothetical protein
LTAIPYPHHYFASMEANHAASEHEEEIRQAASLIRGSRFLTAFTGAGISVESGISPFRGEGGLWSRYDPRLLELVFFMSEPKRFPTRSPEIPRDPDHRFCAAKLKTDSL